MIKTLITLLLLCSLQTNFSQQLYLSNTFRGGVVTRLLSGWGIDSLTINIPANSTISKAVFIAGNTIDSNYPISVYLNNYEIIFNNETQVTNRFSAYSLQTTSSVHVVDITSYINTLSFPQNFIFTAPITAGTFPIGENQNTRFWNYTLYIEYNNDSAPVISSNIFLNNQSILSVINYNFNNLTPIQSNKSIALSFFMGHMVSVVTDGSFIFMNNTDSLGLVYGPEYPPQLTGGSIIGQYDYYNDTLYGYGDDTPDSLMNQADVLADISPYLQNGATGFDIRFEYATPNSTLGVSSNPVWATFLTYSTPCDTFSTSINIPDTTICYGESLVLQASGSGTSISDYQWEVFGNVVGYGDSLAIQPDSSLYYIVKIKDSNGCMKTEMAHIVVNSQVQIGNVVVSPTLCGSATGNIAVENVSGGTSISGAYIYSINGTQNTNISIYYNEFNNLQEGGYNVQVTDFYGCTVNNTVAVGNYINTIAQFSASAQSGEAPLTVTFTNQSSNANSYAWLINGEESPAFAEEVFDSVGVYEVTLYSYGNDTTCVDSASVLINVVSPFRVFIPTFYDANLGSLYLDTRGTKTVTLEIFDEIGKLIYVEKKTVTDGQNEFWKGYNARGIYLYRIFAEGIDGTKLEQGGKLVLMR